MDAEIDAHPNDAAPLTLATRAVSAEAKRLIDILLDAALVRAKAEGGNSRGENRTAGLRCAIEALAGGVLLNAGRHGAREWSYQKLAPPVFTGQAVTKRHFETARETLIAGGWIEERPAFTRFHNWDAGATGVVRRATRFRATPVLLDAAKDHGISCADVQGHFARQRIEADIEPIRLRSLARRSGAQRVEGESLPVPDTHEARQIAAEVAEANRLIRTVSVEGCDPITFFRSYTHDLEHGGRWIAPAYQSLPKEQRAKLRINGASVIEVDVRASHLTVLHGLLERPMPAVDDPYAGLGADRRVVKAWITGTIGKGKPVKRWSRKMQEDAREQGLRLSNYEASVIGDIILHHYPFLSELPHHLGCTDEPRLSSLVLMWWEAEALTRAMRMLRQQGVPSLPMHDALIVRRSDHEVAGKALIAAFMEEVNVRPIVR